MRYRPMSTSGSIVLWFFFFWILLPVYLLLGIVWVLAFLVGNLFTLALVPLVFMVALPAAAAMWRGSVNASKRGYRAVLERRAAH